MPTHDVLSGRRIFIIEDDLANRAIIQTMLEKHGARTSIERWGKDFETRLMEFLPVDLIVLDLMFPDKVSGYDVFDQIRRIPGFQTIPIVAVSAADANEAIPKTQKKGFAGFINKPINFFLFAEQIASILNGKEVWYTD